MWKWVRRIVVALAGAFVALYVGDWAVYKMRGSPQGSVKVSQTLVVPLKGNKSEYDYLGRAMFPARFRSFRRMVKVPAGNCDGIRIRTLRCRWRFRQYRLV